MAPTSQLAEFVAGSGGEAMPSSFAIAPGIVTNNFDAIAEGRVQVRIPTVPTFEPWARVSGVGGGPDRGFFWVPQIDDEVLVAFNQDDERDAYILSGLWSTMDRPPITSPTDALNKRVLKTGIGPAPGHEIEFDDVLGSIEITSITGQKVSIDPSKIELATTGGALTITMDLTALTVSIQAAATLEFKAPQIKIEGLNAGYQGRHDQHAIIRPLPGEGTANPAQLIRLVTTIPRGRPSTCLQPPESEIRPGTPASSAGPECPRF